MVSEDGDLNFTGTVLSWCKNWDRKGSRTGVASLNCTKLWPSYKLWCAA